MPRKAITATTRCFMVSHLQKRMTCNDEIGKRLHGTYCPVSRRRWQLEREKERAKGVVDRDFDSSFRARLRETMNQKLRSGLQRPALAVLALEEVVGFTQVCDLELGAVPFELLAAGLDGDVAEQDELGQHAGVVE